jgi:hypothetical protein
LRQHDAGKRWNFGLLGFDINLLDRDQLLAVER